MRRRLAIERLGGIWLLGAALWGADALVAETEAPAHGAVESYEIVFEPVEGRFFRLVGYGEPNADEGLAGAAELHLLASIDGGAISRESWTILNSSNATKTNSQPAINAWDGDGETLWLSAGESPHHIDIDLNRSVSLAGFRYAPPPSLKGAIHSFGVFVSKDGVDWGDAVMRGTLVPRTGEVSDDTSRGAPEAIPLRRQDFASGGMVHGPVAIDVDSRNRVYVAETYRYDGRGVIDNRGKRRREEDDLQTNTLEQRRAILEAWMRDGELEFELDAHPELFSPDGSDFFEKFSEKVALLEDTNGDGRADLRKIVSTGYNDMLDGAAAGVLVRDDELYFACIPAIWHLRDTDGDDVVDEKVALSRGYGVRTGWFGHDLHGLTWGPDGRLYFTIADRGFDVRTAEGLTYHGPNTGAVFRCWPDGSDLERVASGLRNPQELAFDDLGYLFTGDNNCDAGDRARLVYVVEGGDSGWRVSVQSLPDRGPWMSEAMWEMPRSETALQPAWILPPLAHLNSGPSGMAAYPGTGLPDVYQGYFFLCDYRGGRGSIQAFQLNPNGASFTMSGHHAFNDGPTVSDVCFGYDGKVYVAEWGPGWKISPHARIYTLSHSPTQRSEIVREVQSFFFEGTEGLRDDDLEVLLGHRDRRIRYEAQRQLVTRKSVASFLRVLREASDVLPRLHSVWGLGQLGHRDQAVAEVLLPFFNDSDPEVRGRALRIGAELGVAQAGEAAKAALAAVNHPRLRFHAAYAVGKLRPDGGLEALLQLIQANHEGDAYLRHAAVMGLVYFNDTDGLLTKVETSQSSAARLAAVLVLRRQSDERVSRFLHDESAVVATEAARAIYDREIAGGMEALASALDPYLEKEMAPVPLLRRGIHANFQLGTEPAADRLCRIARADHVPDSMRRLALELLLKWDTPPKREGVWGRWRPLTRETAGQAKGAVRIYLQELLELEALDLQDLAQRLDALYGKEKTPEELAEMVSSPATTELLRIEALQKLEKFRDEHGELYDKVCQAALTTPESVALRAAAVESWARSKGDEALGMIQRVVETGNSALEKQAGVHAVASLSEAAVKPLLARWMQALLKDQLDPQIQLDVFELAENSADATLRKQAETFRSTAGAMGIHSLSLSGGDPQNGQTLYETNLAAQCMRCHALRGNGGDVGPPLDGLARRREPQHILRSVVDPQAEVTKGYGIQTITMKTGDLKIGTLISENAKRVVIRNEGSLDELLVEDITARSPEVSGMPPAGLVLKPRELRDLLAFLQTLK